MRTQAKIGIGVNAWVWTSPFDGRSLPLIRKAVDMGFDAFTLPVEDPDLIQIKSVRAALRDSSIRLHVSGAYGPDRDLTHDDPAIRKNSLDYIRETLKICEQLGVKILAGPAYSAVGKRRQISPEQKKIEWDRAVEGLTQAGKMAADHGVVMAIEPLNRFETDLVNTSAQVKQLIQDIDLQSVKIHLDTFHMNIEEKSLLEAVRLAGDDLVYVDASESDRGAPGSGQVHWQTLAQGLAEIGFRGDCIVESFTPDCKTIADAAAIWRPLAATQDDLARDGQKFLRQLLP